QECGRTHQQQSRANSVSWRTPRNTHEHVVGGGGGIRTHETVARLHAFQACAFNHSATPPQSAQSCAKAAHYSRHFFGRNTSAWHVRRPRKAANPRRTGGRGNLVADAPPRYLFKKACVNLGQSV